MNKEEVIGKLQMVYVGDRNALNELVGYYDGLKQGIEELQQENKQLKEQLDYIRSGEYYNQLRFERDMLQDIVEKGEIPKEDKEFIDCTHRNTELLEENKQLKERVEYLERSNNRREDTIIGLRQELADSEVSREKAIKYIEQTGVKYSEEIKGFKEIGARELIKYGSKTTELANMSRFIDSTEVTVPHGIGISKNVLEIFFEKAGKGEKYKELEKEFSN